MAEWNEEEIYEKAAIARALSPFTRGEIEFRDVSACYRPELGDVLRGVSFKVRAGEKVGVVGRTGSGKSTLFLVLLRIIAPRAGTVFVDGVDCARVGLASLRASVNFILQEHFLFAGTVRAVLLPLRRTRTPQTRTPTRKSRTRSDSAAFGRDCSAERA